ncbi:MAG: hypothetical protein ABIB47_01395 [Candidatus Woesearchaeota archaeon]
MEGVSKLLFLLGGIAVILVIIIVWMVRPKGNKIEKTIKGLFDKRKGIREVLNYGRVMKWKDKEIKLYYLLFSMQSFMRKGYGLEEVKNMAGDAGWEKDLIDIVGKKLR